jgi:CheY-like chemotaxis protein
VRRILVIDDDASSRKFLRFVLEKQGYEVSEATNGAEGLQRYQADPTNLVMTDLQMPGMDGREVLEALRRLVPTPALLAIWPYTNSGFTNLPSFVGSDMGCWVYEQNHPLPHRPDR